MEVEVAVRLLYMLGEALPASHGAHFTGDTAKTSALQDMMRTVGHRVRLVRRASRRHGYAHSVCSPPTAGVVRREQLPAQLRVAGVL